ncbi:MAG TPA: LytTR family DNA-binding domain-containing protein [Vicinamibacterales bacterium]|jgi:two-component system LytT family response regulator
MTNNLRVLVVDDEKPGRERLRNLLRRDSRVELVACCAGGAEALDAIEQAERAERPVQMLFLDVQMPELDGFGVIASLVRRRGSDGLPVVVFVTAHDEYALRAFEAHAIDYLMKPFSDERFQATLDRAVRHARAGLAETLMTAMRSLLERVARGAAVADTQSSEARQKPALDRIVVKGPNRVRLLPVEQISWIEAEGPYVKLHTRDGNTHVHRELLGSLDRALDERRFVRIHRSAIVNIDLVDELRQDAHGDYVACLRDRTQIRVGRRFRARLQARLGQPL